MTGATVGLAVNPAQALTLFAGPYYDPPKWTASIVGNGSVNENQAPNSIELVGPNTSSTANNRKTDYTIQSPSAGTVSFNWQYTSIDTRGLPSFDPFGYLIGGSFTPLTNSSGPLSQSGFASFSVLAGEEFGFRQMSTDNINGGATTTITNFDGPVPVPAPLPLLGASLPLGYCFRLRSRSKRLRHKASIRVT